MSAIEACRAELWQALLGSVERRFILHSESPLEYAVPGEWIRELSDTWAVPPAFDPIEHNTASWLSLGGWVAYSACSAVAPWPDIFRMQPQDAVGWARQHGVAAAMISFPDDIEWRIVLGA